MSEMDDLVPPSATARLSPDFVAIGKAEVAGTLHAQARLLGARIDTRGVAGDAEVARLAEEAGLTFVFRYGVAVTLQAVRRPTAALDAAIGMHVLEASDQEIETATLSIRTEGRDRVGPDGEILLADASPERLLLAAIALARSVVLARDEILVSEAFESIIPLATELRNTGRLKLPIRRVMKLVGNVLAARHRVMGTVQVDERPDVLWDHPALDTLYVRLEAEYELKERSEILERKFVALGDSARDLLDIVQEKRAFRLEAAIIALIAFEIVLTLYNMAAH